MDLQLTGKIALVTGGSRGIGLAIVRALVAEGATVIGCARTMSSELANSGADAVLRDLATDAGASEAVREVLDRHGDIDILVNNVGGGDAADLRDFFDYDDDLWHKTFDLNLFAAVRTCRAAVPSVVRRRGLVVNISSLGARLPHTGPVPYTTAKAALTAFSKALAEELGPKGVRVVTVTPGPTLTPTWTEPGGVGSVLAAAQGISHAELLARLATDSGIVSGRLIEPGHVASLIAFLSSPAAASITGQEYLVDGGALKTA